MLHQYSLLKNNSETSSSMPYHLMPRHISLLKNNSENLKKSLIPRYTYLLKNNKKTLKMYYNPLRIINDEFSQYASMTCHLMSRDLSPLKIILKTLENIFF
jgi:hypothetical protein